VTVIMMKKPIMEMTTDSKSMEERSWRRDFLMVVEQR